MARKKKKVEEEEGDSFIVMFTSLSVILLAFFILLNSLATPDEKKERTALGSLAGAFGILTGGFGFDPNTVYFEKGAPMIKASEEIQILMKKVKRGMEKMEFATGVEFHETAQDYRISFRDGLFFQLGRAELDPVRFPVLDIIAQHIKSIRFPVNIEGHTDSLLSKGGERQNWLLSTQRAMAVLRYFQEAAKVRRRYLQAGGYAHYHPKVPNTTPQNRAQNRRVEIVFIKPKFRKR